MSQKIDPHDVASLSERGRHNYREFWRATHSDIDDIDIQEIPLMSVTDMIAYLAEKHPLTQDQFNELWGYVKEVLEETE